MDHSPKSHFGLQYSGGREEGRVYLPWKGSGFFPCWAGEFPPISKNLTSPIRYSSTFFWPELVPPLDNGGMIYEEWLPSEDCNFRRNPAFDGRIDGIFVYFWTSEWSNLTTGVLDCVQIFRKANESRFPVSRYPTPPGNKCWPNNSLFWIKFWFLKNFSIKSNIFVLDIYHTSCSGGRIFLAVGVWYMVNNELIMNACPDLLWCHHGKIYCETFDNSYTGTFMWHLSVFKLH